VPAQELPSDLGTTVPCAHVATWHLKMGTAQRGKASGRPKARSTACRSSEKAIAHTSSVVRTWCAGRDVASALRAVGGWGARAACNHAKPRKHTRWRAATPPGRRGVVSASNLHGSRQQHTQQTVKSKMWWRGQGWGLCMRGGRGAVTRTVARNKPEKTNKDGNGLGVGQATHSAGALAGRRPQHHRQHWTRGGLSTGGGSWGARGLVCTGRARGASRFLNRKKPKHGACGGRRHTPSPKQRVVQRDANHAFTTPICSEGKRRTCAAGTFRRRTSGAGVGHGRHGLSREKWFVARLTR
jgi:hypothetical protein